MFSNKLSARVNWQLVCYQLSLSQDSIECVWNDINLFMLQYDTRVVCIKVWVYFKPSFQQVFEVLDEEIPEEKQPT